MSGLRRVQRQVAPSVPPHRAGQGDDLSQVTLLSKAQGTWFCFLDDDDQFSQITSRCCDAVTTSGLKGAYAFPGVQSTRMVDAAFAQSEEVSFDRIPDDHFHVSRCGTTIFSRFQSVLFHRSLYDAWRIRRDMDQLEDWNLWTRYTMRDDFVQVRKLTSNIACRPN